MSDEEKKGFLLWLTDAVAVVVMGVGGAKHLTVGDVRGFAPWLALGAVLGAAGRNVWRVGAAYQTWRRSRPAPALAPTKMGSVELLIQEPLAQQAVRSSFKIVETALSALIPVANATTAGNQRASSHASQADLARAVVTLNRAWREHGEALAATLPALNDAVTSFEAAVGGMLECWAAYASKGPRPLEPRSDPTFRGWLEFCAGGMRDRSTDVARLNNTIVSNARGHNQATDVVIDQLSAVLSRLTSAIERLADGANEMVVVLDATRSWGERVRWKLWRRRRARERRSEAQNSA